MEMESSSVATKAPPLLTTLSYPGGAGMSPSATVPAQTIVTQMQLARKPLEASRALVTLDTTATECLRVRALWNAILEQITAIPTPPALKHQAHSCAHAMLGLLEMGRAARM